MEPQKHYFFSCQYVHNCSIANTQVFGYTNAISARKQSSKAWNTTLKIPCTLACAHLCVYTRDRDRGRDRMHAHACQLIFKNMLRWLLIKLEVRIWNHTCYKPLLQSRLSLSQQRTSDKLRPLPPVHLFLLPFVLSKFNSCQKTKDLPCQ